MGDLACSRLWRGFLGSTLSSADLLWFALVTFVRAPNSLRYRLVKHLFTDVTGAQLVQAYLGIDIFTEQRRLPLPAVAGLVFVLSLVASRMGEY